MPLPLLSDFRHFHFSPIFAYAMRLYADAADAAFSHFRCFRYWLPLFSFMFSSSDISPFIFFFAIDYAASSLFFSFCHWCFSFHAADYYYAFLDLILSLISSFSCKILLMSLLFSFDVYFRFIIAISDILIFAELSCCFSSSDCFEITLSPDLLIFFTFRFLLRHIFDYFFLSLFLAFHALYVDILRWLRIDAWFRWYRRGYIIFADMPAWFSSMPIFSPLMPLFSIDFATLRLIIIYLMIIIISFSFFFHYLRRFDIYFITIFSADVWCCWLYFGFDFRHDYWLFIFHWYLLIFSLMFSPLMPCHFDVIFTLLTCRLLFSFSFMILFRCWFSLMLFSLFFRFDFRWWWWWYAKFARHACICANAICAPCRFRADAVFVRAALSVRYCRAIAAAAMPAVERADAAMPRRCRFAMMFFAVRARAPRWCHLGSRCRAMARLALLRDAMFLRARCAAARHIWLCQRYAPKRRCAMSSSHAARWRRRAISRWWRSALHVLCFMRAWCFAYCFYAIYYFISLYFFAWPCRRFRYFRCRLYFLRLLSLLRHFAAWYASFLYCRHFAWLMLSFRCFFCCWLLMLYFIDVSLSSLLSSLSPALLYLLSPLFIDFRHFSYFLIIYFDWWLLPFSSLSLTFRRLLRFDFISATFHRFSPLMLFFRCWLFSLYFRWCFLRRRLLIFSPSFRHFFDYFHTLMMPFFISPPFSLFSAFSFSPRRLWFMPHFFRHLMLLIFADWCCFLIRRLCRDAAFAFDFWFSLLFHAACPPHYLFAAIFVMPFFSSLFLYACCSFFFFFHIFFACWYFIWFLLFIIDDFAAFHFFHISSLIFSLSLFRCRCLFSFSSAHCWLFSLSSAWFRMLSSAFFYAISFAADTMHAALLCHFYALLLPFLFADDFLIFSFFLLLHMMIFFFLADDYAFRRLLRFRLSYFHYFLLHYLFLSLFSPFFDRYLILFAAIDAMLSSFIFFAIFVAFDIFAFCFRFDCWFLSCCFSFLLSWLLFSAISILLFSRFHYLPLILIFFCHGRYIDDADYAFFDDAALFFCRFLFDAAADCRCFAWFIFDVFAPFWFLRFSMLSSHWLLRRQMPFCYFSLMLAWFSYALSLRHASSDAFMIIFTPLTLLRWFSICQRRFLSPPPIRFFIFFLFTRYFLIAAAFRHADY